MNCEITYQSPFGAVIRAKNEQQHVRDIDINKLKEIFQQEQLIVLRGFQTFVSADEFSGYCEQWGEVSLWPFGKVLELIEQEDPEDHIFDNSYVPLHWDGMYRPQVPEYQIFHCVNAPKSEQGGRTTFSNTKLALSHCSEDTKKTWETLTGTYQRKMEFYNSKTVSPLITKHPTRDFSVIRYNEPPGFSNETFINPPDIEISGADDKESKEIHVSIREALYNPQNFYAHEWKTGDVVIADNFSLLHGREGFATQSKRHLQRVQVLSNPPYDNPGLESYQ